MQSNPQKSPMNAKLAPSLHFTGFYNLHGVKNYHASPGSLSGSFRMNFLPSARKHHGIRNV
jgi:hypothetical protein